MRLFRKMIYLLVLLCFTTAVAQATTCSAMVQQALSVVQQGCGSTARNQACYGYVSLNATPRDGAQNFTFAQAGDLANVADIDTLRLSALDTTNNTWGIALMKLQANLPDTLPGENVTFLMFGDVQITNAVKPGQQQATVQVTATTGANIRTTPSTNGQIAGSLVKGDMTIANGRSSDSSWLRIQIPNSSSLGWVFASLLTPASDVSALSVVDSTQAQTNYTPMQAFYFTTGITQTGCSTAPADGILIQTPQGVGQINLLANDVNIQLGSTAFLQAQANGGMTVSVVEGEAHVTALGKTVAVPAGAQVSVPIDQNLEPSAVPGDPQPYDAGLVAPLPIQDLPLQITIAPPASAAQIAAANNAATPTPRPTAASGAASVNLPGTVGDIGSLDTMSEADFCQYMDSVFGQIGMNRQQYIAQMQSVEGLVPASEKAQLDKFIDMLNACP